MVPNWGDLVDRVVESALTLSLPNMSRCTPSRCILTMNRQRSRSV